MTFFPNQVQQRGWGEGIKSGGRGLGARPRPPRSLPPTTLPIWHWLLPPFPHSFHLQESGWLIFKRLFWVGGGGAGLWVWVGVGGSAVRQVSSDPGATEEEEEEGEESCPPPPKKKVCDPPAPLPPPPTQGGGVGPCCGERRGALWEEEVGGAPR